jgi:DNA-binding CsgD family transcriptional regulator
MSTQNDVRGRDAECAALEVLLDAARKGESRTVVLRGEAGVGKSALLDYAIGSAHDFRVLRSVGVESEMELAFASLHQLCAPLLDRRESLPDPQKAALEVAFGLDSGPAPDRFLVGLATLSLLDELADEQPLLCVIDDAQWLDRASALAFALVARRLLAEPICLLVAVREPIDVPELAGLPELMIGGLSEDDARVLLGSHLPGRLDERVRDRIVAESRGNPLALIELPRGLTPGELAGGFALPDARPLADRIEQSFIRQVRSLPLDSQRLLLTAAAEPFGDVSLLWRAADRLGLGSEAAAPAEATGLLQVDTLVRFRHPLVRSAVYGAASLSDRQEAHRALAESIDPEVDPERRAWHRAQGAPGPDEEVAAELERSADRAQACGGVAAAAAFLERAATLTPEPGRRSQRALEAAQAKIQAGAFDQAAALLAMAQAGPLDEMGRARIDLLRAHMAFAQHRGGEAPPLLLAAGRRLEALDAGLARETYLDACVAAIFAGRLAEGVDPREVGEAARDAPPSPEPRVSDRLLAACAARLIDGMVASAPLAEQALTAFDDGELSVQESLRWLWLGVVIAADLWDDERWLMLSTRHVAIVRESGALSEVPLAFDACAAIHLFAGKLQAAEMLVQDVATVCEVTGIDQARMIPLWQAAWRGREIEARFLIDAILNQAVARGEGAAVGVTHWLHALMCNGLGRYEEALTAARMGVDQDAGLSSATRWSMVELVEAAARTDAFDVGSETLEHLTATTRASGTDWALGVEARSRALLSEGDPAEALYREAIDRLARTRVRAELARAHLVYGEWLRREQRRTDARQQLRAAHEMFTEMGVEGFAERTRQELLATGATARRRAEDTGSTLTPQEAQIARLARNGLSNPEIGERLFISPRTVQYHLHKVFQKLDITSRNKLGQVLPDRIGIG